MNKIKCAVPEGREWETEKLLSEVKNDDKKEANREQKNVLALTKNDDRRAQ